ncbi:MAG: WxL protein peptidoglycan domain-containing protein [Candidatus Saccharimonadales bacterium]
MLKLKFRGLRASFNNFAFVLALAGALIITTVLPAGAASAQSSGAQANGFVISPVKSEITVRKGQSQNVQLSVENPTLVKTTVKAVVNDFVASNDESGTPRLILNNKTPLPANNFKTLVNNIPEIKLAPNQKQYINVTISVPASANSGGYYGAIRFAPANVSQKSNVGLTASAGSLFLVTVPGNLTEKANLVQLSAAGASGNASSFLTSGKVSVLARLKNVGNIQVKPFGKIRVIGTFGHQVASFEFNSSGGDILPASTRKFVKQLKHQSWFGRYRITANLAYQNGGGSLINASSTFYYFPVWFLIVVAVVILIIIGLIYRLATRKSRRPKPKSGKKA